MYAIVTKSQAKEIANSINGLLALNCEYSTTSTRITTVFHEFENDKDRGLLEVYSDYTRENVLDELPEQFQELNFFEIDPRDLEAYLHNN